MRIGEVPLDQSSKLSLLEDIFLRLNIGDTIRAQVVEIFTNEVLLKLFDGSVKRASLMQGLDAKPGDNITLKVVNKNNGQLFLESIKSSVKDDVQVDFIKNRLISMGIKPTARNIKIAQEIISRDIEFNPEQFREINEAINGFKSLKPEEAVFLKANNLEINRENIDLLRQISSGQFRIDRELGKLFIDIQKNENMELDNSSQIIDSQTKGEFQSANENSNEKVLSGSISLEETDMPKPLTSQASIPVERANQQVQQEIQQGGLQHTDQQPPQWELEASADKIDFRNDLFDKQPFEIPQKAENSIDNFSANIKQMKDKVKLSELELDEAVKLDLPKSEKDASERSRIKSFSENLKDEIYISLSDSDQKPAESIKRNIKSLEDILQSIRDYSTQAGFGRTDEIALTAESIQNKLSFIKSINNQFNYYQLPINIKDNETTSELYIMKRKNRGYKKPEDTITFYISLDTMNMGYVGSLIEINKKNISMNLKLENKEVIEYFKDNRKLLYNRFLEMGYRLVDVKYKLPEEKVNILNFVKVKNQEQEEKTASIDLRI